MPTTAPGMRPSFASRSSATRMRPRRPGSRPTDCGSARARTAAAGLRAVTRHPPSNGPISPFYPRRAAGANCLLGCMATGSGGPLSSDAAQAHVLLGVGADLVHREVCAIALLLGRQAQAQHDVDHGEDDEPGEEACRRTHDAADELGGKAHPARAAERLEAEDAAGDAAPEAAQAVQRPYAQD